MDLVNTVATDLENDYSTAQTREDSHDNHVDLGNSHVQEGRPNTEKCTTHDVLPGEREHPGDLDPPPAANGHKPRRKLLKMNVWFTQDDARLVQKIATARGQNAEDFIRVATLNLLAELDAIGEERKRLLIMLRS